MYIYIKNMVCTRCIMTVNQIFSEAGVENVDVEIGKVKLDDPLSTETMDMIHKRLNKVGFEIISDSKSRIIEEIRQVIINFVYHHSEPLRINFSAYLADKLNLDYNYLSALFSSAAGTTIEKYLIDLKIEHVKELLVYDEKNLSEIAFDMGYSSVAHLSGQFKRITGFTPTHFKTLGKQKRRPINEI